ncbi:redoxin family protein [Lutibacter holmesii]|uniref:Redoxin family protein n=1 Tax=Lutibacter holmesii TaxID=1137985 RepID=A0ABW3WLN6_9FLAO
MLKKLLITLFFIATVAQGQHIVKGTMAPIDETVSWVALYQLKGSKQIYIDNVTIENGTFSINIPENAPKGMYRLRFKMEASGNVNFIYNKENLDVKFDPNMPAETIEFSTSEDNKLYYSFLNQTAVLKQQLDAIQYRYFKLKTVEEKVDSRVLYKSTLLSYTATQQEFEEKSKDKLAYHFIKAGKKYYNETLFESAQEYLNSEKTHYFDYIDFTDVYLQNSTEITEYVLNYVFYFNVSEDPDVQFALHKSAIDNVMYRLEDNASLRAEVTTTLLFTFSQRENLRAMEYLMVNYYNKLPATLQNEVDIETILNNVRLAVGKNAPDFSWDENGASKSLYALNKAETYVLVFWSTSCSHCVVEVPELYEFLKDKPNIHVVDVALENDRLGYDVYKEKFLNWTNVLGLGKWENSIAKTYEIVSTPTYFILDANKKIIAKPEYVKDVKTYFGN